MTLPNGVVQHLLMACKWAEFFLSDGAFKQHFIPRALNFELHSWIDMSLLQVKPEDSDLKMESNLAEKKVKCRR